MKPTLKLLLTPAAIEERVLEYEMRACSYAWQIQLRVLTTSQRIDGSSQETSKRKVHSNCNTSSGRASRAVYFLYAPYVVRNYNCVLAQLGMYTCCVSDRHNCFWNLGKADMSFHALHSRKREVEWRRDVAKESSCTGTHKHLHTHTRTHALTQAGTHVSRRVREQTSGYIPHRHKIV